MAGSFLSHWPCSSAFFDPDSRLAIRVPSLLFEVSTIFYLLFSRIIDFHVPSASNLQLLTFNSSSFTQTLFHTTIFALRTTSLDHNQNSNPQFQVLPWHPYLIDNELKPLHHRVSALTLSLFLFACYSIPKIKHRSHPDPTVGALCHRINGFPLFRNLAKSEGRSTNVLSLSPREDIALPKGYSQSRQWRSGNWLYSLSWNPGNKDK